MQALSIWPSKNEFWVVPKLDMEVSQVGSYCIASTKRRCGLVLVSSSSKGIKSRACFGSAQFDIEFRLFSEYSKFKVCVYCEPKKKGSFGASVALSWTLEGQEIADEFVKEDSGLLSGNNVNCDNVDEIKKNVLVLDENNNPEENEEGKDVENEKVGKKKSARVDVRSLAWSLRFAKTAEDVEEVLKDKGDLPLQVYSTMIRGLGKDKRLHSAMALVQWLKKRKKDDNRFVGPNLFVYNSLLGAVKQSEQFEEAEKVMHDMATEGVIPNVVTYNTLMSIYIEQGQAIKALNLFQEIERKGLSPSPASYSTALLAYRRLEDGFGALKFFVELKEKYQNGRIGKHGGEDWENEFAKLENFTVRICHQVIRQWLVKSGNLSIDVLKLLTDMDRAGLQTGKAEYERLVWACTREEHYIVVKELYSRITESNSEISLSVCNHVIWLMGKAKKWWAALEIYEDLLDKGPKPNNMSYELVVSHFNILLTAARRRGIWKWGIRLLDKMEEKGLKPGSREWNAVLVACSKASETSAAVRIFRRMVERGEKPTIISYGALLSALEKGKLYDEALRVWENMIKVGVEPNVYAYTIMASIYTAQGKFNIVDSIIRDMISSGIEPTVVTFNAIISGCAETNISALSEAGVIYVMTHDSIGLGEDGPTHQPIEHLASFRAMPNVLMLRPADGNETAGAYKVAVLNRKRPSILALSRQKLSHLPGTSVEGVEKGGYTVSDNSSGNKPDVILMGTGSELEIASKAADELRKEGKAVRVVSFVSWELFDEQSDAYKESVLPAAVTARVSIEAGSTFGWAKHIGSKGKAIGIDRFGASAPAGKIYKEFGITAEAVIAAAKSLC